MQIAPEIIECLQRNGTVLTANVRTQRALLRQFSEFCRNQGLRAWVAPAFFDWDSWLSHAWEQFRGPEEETLLVLGRLQEQYVWKEVIRRSVYGPRLFRHEAMASLAMEAYALLHDYEQQSQRRTPWGAEDWDARAFQVWAEEFDRECRRKEWISRSAIPVRLAEKIASSSSSEELLLVGFDRLTPAMQRLLDAWTTAGSSWKNLEQRVESAHQEFLAATDFRQELKDCALWLRNKLMEDPQARLAVVLPDGHGTRGEIERTLRRVLAPESLLLTDPFLTEKTAAPLPFEFSLGVPLSQVEEIRAALLILSWLTTPLEDEELRWLLSSGFIAQSYPETLKAAELYYTLRKRGSCRNEWSLSAFLAERKLNQSAALHDLMRRLTRLSNEAGTQNISARTQSPLDWVSLSAKLLHIAGWPGAIRKGSAQFQVQQRWEHLLDEVTTLGFDGSSLYFNEFFGVLQKQASETVFAEESRGAPVQIMGPLETSGQIFDGIWFLGAEEQNWPAKANAHPLIPLWIARPAKMPHATAEVDWELARTVTERIAASASEVIFSYAQRNPDGELRPSPVVKRLFALPATSLKDQVILLPEASDLEPIVEETLIPFPAERVAGGSDVLKRQAACPFRAFAGIRLEAQSLAPTEMGLTAAQRGTLLHSILEALWKKFRDQEGLLQQRASGTLQATVSEIVRLTIADHPATQNKEGWRAAYFYAEQQRLERLILEWLEFEATRIPFSDVQVEREQKHVDVGNLRLHMRIDRLDTIAEGRKLLLDYKTGKVSPRNWDGPRPEDPQLPLYALFGELGDICGLLLAQIRTGEVGVRGRAENATASIHPALGSKTELVKKPLTEDMRAQWRVELERLAADFLRGETDVNPKNPVKTCQTCDLPSLCRKAETNITLRAAELDESEIADDQNGN